MGKLYQRGVFRVWRGGCLHGGLALPPPITVAIKYGTSYGVWYIVWCVVHPMVWYILLCVVHPMVYGTSYGVWYILVCYNQCCVSSIVSHGALCYWLHTLYMVCIVGNTSHSVLL